MAAKQHADGIFTPIVKVCKNAMGDKEFTKFRGKMISYHSNSACSIALPVPIRVALTAACSTIRCAFFLRSHQGPR